MKRVPIISTAVLSLLLGASALAYVPQEQQGEEQHQKQDEKPAKPEKPANLRKFEHQLRR